MSSHNLLLRLFLAPGFFSVYRALQYIRNYSDNVGITHYLTHRLDQVPTDELAETWMLICHLLVTRPSQSAALETFVLRKAQESTVLALLTLCFLQASLNDLATRRNTQSFAICSRVLQSITHIIYAEPYSQINPSDGTLLPLLPRRKVKPHMLPALVGIGVVLASCPGLPIAANTVGQTAVEQGWYVDPKTPPEATGSMPTTTQAANVETPQKNMPPEASPSEGDSDSEQSESEEDVEAYGRALIAAREAAAKAESSASSTLNPPPSPTLSRRNTVGSLRKLDKPEPRISHRRTASTRPTASSPSLPNLHLPAKPMLRPRPAQLAAYQSRLLRSHYLHSEVQFLQTLSAISDRLLVIPKPARVSALRAELTNLNHQLPAEICLPLWCNYPKKGNFDTDTQSHHRIVRIPPSESVVLNSAERAPYLMLVEILRGDMDFNPATPVNKELLMTIQKSGPSPIREISPVSIAQESLRPTPLIGSSVNALELGAIVPPTPLSRESALDDADEEVDLVEQLYGTNLSVKTVDINLTDSIVLPVPPKNKALDVANWSRRSSSNPSTPRPSSSGHIPAHINQGVRHSLSLRASPGVSPDPSAENPSLSNPPLSLDDYSNRMEAAAVMLAQLNANVVREPVTGAFGEKIPAQESTSGVLSWIPGSGWIRGSSQQTTDGTTVPASQLRMRLQPAEAAAIKKRIMEEMMALEEERMLRMQYTDNPTWSSPQDTRKTAEDEGIVRRELNKLDPSAALFQESFALKKARVRASSQYGHLANWDCISVIVKTGADLRQEQLAGLLIQEFSRIWREEKCQCWVRYFRILVMGSNSGLVETITDAVSIHSIKKAEYARRLVEGRFTNVSLRDYFIATYGDPSSAKFARAQKNFAVSLAGYSVISYLLQIKDRHNGNLLLDRDGHIIHIDFGFILESSPGGNLGFEAAPFKLPLEYVDLLGGLDSKAWKEFKEHFRHGFETARKHCDSIITIVELMQKDSTLQCFAAFGEQTAQRLRDRFQPTLTHSLVGEHVEKLIEASIGSAWTRLYDSVSGNQLAS
ncbi:related to PIK1-phosphatidylinositol 4-kinase [Serendipita indica DSM 11827]|uniref:1-phosphatidylinositol 4-kinase n=1 Tax=Serendipita indica (strain DSM 11827) TaxID=1109443 RepID=G4T6F5_SERID|nr:related to PIK1-phosphatidylinositol 4-kinase [Serendipita indica DSM 11827]